MIYGLIFDHQRPASLMEQRIYRRRKTLERFRLNRMPIVNRRLEVIHFLGPLILILSVLTLILTVCVRLPHANLLSQNFHSEKSEKKVIFVTSNGWHTGITLAKVDLPTDRLKEIKDFPTARFLEFGWGDADFYPANKVSLGITLRAALIPTPAIVHVVGLQMEPARAFPKAEVVSLEIGDEDFARLVDFVDASFERQGEIRTSASEPGLYPTSRFYPGSGSFHLFNTCNTWTAQALAAAGLNVRAMGTFRAEALMKQVRALAKTNGSDHHLEISH